MSAPTPTAALQLSHREISIAFDPVARRFLPASLTTTITNVGIQVDQFNIEILDLPEGWSTRSVPGVRMRPGLTEAAQITFHPPVTPESRAGSHPFRVRVTPSEQPGAFSEHTASLTIAPFDATTLRLVEPERQSDNSTATFQAHLTNGGNLPLTFSVTASRAEPAGPPLEFRFPLLPAGAGETLSVPVPPGQTALVELEVTVPPTGGVAPRPGPYAFHLTATPLPVVEWPALEPASQQIAGRLVLVPPPPVQARLEPTTLEIVELLRQDVSCSVIVDNPSQRRVGVALKTESQSPELQVHLERDRLVLEPQTQQQVLLTIVRSAQAAPATTVVRHEVLLKVIQVELPPSTDPFERSVVIARMGDVEVLEPPPMQILVQPPGLKLDLSPKKRRGGKGRYRIAVTNQGRQRVRAMLDLAPPADDADRLDYTFGHQPSGFKAAVKRIFFRVGVREAEYRVRSRLSARTQQVLDAAGVQGSVEPDDDDQTRRQSGFPVVLEPGKKVEVPLEVRPDRFRLLGRSHQYAFRVAGAVDGKVVESLTADAEFEHRPFPIWLALLAILIPVLLLVPIIMLKLGCDRGTLEFSPYCVPPPIVAAPPATLRQEGGHQIGLVGPPTGTTQSGSPPAAAPAGAAGAAGAGPVAGQTKILVRDEAVMRQVASEPASKLPGQFAKLVVPSPDKQYVLYVTADDELLTNANLKLADRNGTSRVLATIPKGLWTAKPVWCQTGPNDPGRIAIVTAADQVQPPRTGLQLQIISVADAQPAPRPVADGLTTNGLAPAIFYGRQETPLQWWDNCSAIKYTGADGKRYVIDTKAAQPAPTLIRTFGLPDAPTVSAQTPASGGLCEDRPFAQSDPRWARVVIGKPGGPLIGQGGCALAAAATVFKYYKQDVTPAGLLQCAPDAVDFVRWKEVADKCAQGKITNVSWVENPSYQQIGDSLQAKHPAIIGLAGGPTGSHYVIAAEGTGDSGNDYRIWDPWDGSTYKRLSDYLETGTYRLKYLVRYEGSAPACGPTTAAAPAAPTTSTAIRFSGIQDGATSREPVRVEYTAPAGATGSSPSGTTFDKEGFHSVGVALTDGTYRSVNFFVDKTPPKTLASWKQDENKLSGVLTLTATDATTPIARTVFNLENEPERDYLGDVNLSGHTQTRGIPLEFKAKGDYRVFIYSIDAAGNRETKTEFIIKAGEGLKSPRPQISQTKLDFSTTRTSLQVQLSAVDGVGDLAWKATIAPAAAAWLTIEPREGTLKVGDAPVSLRITVNRDGLPQPGDFNSLITIGGTQTSGTSVTSDIEIVGQKVAPPATPTPVAPPAPKPGEIKPGEKPQGGTGACSPNQQPFVEPDKLTIELIRQFGTLTLRDANNECIQWYATALPDWLTLEAEDINRTTGQVVTRDVRPLPNGATRLEDLFTTTAGKKSTITIRPDWNRIINGQMTEGQIILREDSNAARRVTLVVRVGQDRRSITVERR